MGILLKSTTDICLLMKCTLIHTTTTIKHDRHGTQQEIVGFSTVSIILGILEIPDIFVMGGGG